MKTKPNLSFARLLSRLLTEELNFSEFQSSNRKWLAAFTDDGVLDFRIIGKQQRRVFCPDAANLTKYLHNKFEIPSLENYISFLEKEDIQRSDAVLANSDSKIRRIKVFSGFLVNCLNEIECELEGAPFVISQSSAAFTFIASYKTFRIPSDVTVVVVEGHENFRDVNRQRDLFSKINPLFVWRYQNSTQIAEWLTLIPNDFLHFGDFDPKGVHIFLSEFQRKIGRGTFFIPDNIEYLLATYGERELYEKQKEYISQIRHFGDANLNALLDLICLHKKGLAQEILIAKGGAKLG